MGCLPKATVFSGYNNCSELFNGAAKYHNQVLANEVQKLNKETKDSHIFLLDLYGAFMSALTKNGQLSGKYILSFSFFKMNLYHVTPLY